ncbi:hypothetical protein F2P56_025899 [Juglans regia]|uniref:Srp40 C-terminal domain-containing protein n=2 Tax=Juglans regia TaxID=51240 RepID=A0A833TWG3_JUGRE|nr:nucleolar and coiled-body phosphoprotein 1-like [Juglans regia]KAF5456410.1 hypothetical protein F2P56_025899 [Juglans regia]
MTKPSSDKAASGSLTVDQTAFLHEAVAQFLDRNGFSKTLKKFRSEAKVEKDCLKGSTLDLEEMYYKYLETWSHPNTKVKNQNEQHTKNNDVGQRDGEGDSTVAVETGSKKNKKNSESDKWNVVSQFGATVELLDSKNSKEQITNGATPESNVKDSELHMEEHDKKNKEKKKKKTTEEKSKEMVASEGQSVGGSDTGKRSKDKKKKKDKPIYDIPDDAKQCNLDDKLGEVSARFKDVECSRDPQIKNHGSTLEESTTPDVDAANNKKKSSKKRKRLASDESNFQLVDKETSEELKCMKAEGLEESKRSEQQAKANGNLEESGEKPAFQKSKKQRNGSVEPKTVNAFQRVKADEVVFTDDRLKDNSYWAKDGAESGYGAKAQEILGQVRGRDFRHEKTKKKRGTYRGGLIDLHSHSVKFNYSDDE